MGNMGCTDYREDGNGGYPGRWATSLCDLYLSYDCSREYRFMRSDTNIPPLSTVFAECHYQLPESRLKPASNKLLRARPLDRLTKKNPKYGHLLLAAAVDVAEC